MQPGETPIEMARRHVAQGEAHVRRQREIVARLSERQLPSQEAMELLLEFEDTLQDHRASLARMEQEQQLGQRDASGNLQARDA